MSRQSIQSILLAITSVVAMPDARAQIFSQLFHVPTDTAYVSEHDRDLTVRPYIERNFNQYRLINTRTDRNITYQPNAPLQAGLGLSYRIVGLGFGVALPYVNRYNKYSKGKITDFSSHFYLRRMVVDAYYQYYEGQHLQRADEQLKGWRDGDVYTRPDITTKVLGIGFHYILKPKKFSLEPLSFVHYQKKSAGSAMLGAQLTRTGITGDSTLAPTQIDHDPTGGFPLIRTLTWNAALSAGYAYSLILRKHIFFTAALNAGAGISFGQMDGLYGQQLRGTGILLNGTARLAAGYNSDYFFAGIQYIGYTGINQTPITYLKQQYSIGKINLTVARRIAVRRKLLGFY